jgi:hypothetical protein
MRSLLDDVLEGLAAIVIAGVALCIGLAVLWVVCYFAGGLWVSLQALWPFVEECC